MEAADGIEALRLLDRHHFDIMITDLVMPRLDGFGLVAETRLKWPKVPHSSHVGLRGRICSSGFGRIDGISAEAYRSNGFNRDRSTPPPHF
jgi:Response regulator receiver domain